MNRRYALLTAAPTLLLGLAACVLADAPADLGGTLPPGMNATWLVRFAKPLDADAARDVHFSLDPAGHAWLFLRDSLVLARPEMAPATDTLKVAGVERIDDAAWMPGGALLVVSGSALGEVGKDGFSKILSLPAAGMRLQAASEEECYLFGGASAETRGAVYLYRKGGKLLRLIQSQEPIDAVTGNGRFTFFAAGATIYAHSDGEPVRAVYTAEAPVTSLDLVPPAGILYTTSASVGYVSRPGLGFSFLSGRNPSVRSYGRELYVLLPDLGLVRCAPAQFLERAAHDRMMAKSGGSALTEFARAEIDRGVAATQRKDFASAIEHFQRAREDAPYAAEPLLDLALACDGAGGREVPAMLWYHAYLSANPDAADAPYARAKIAELTARAQANVRRLRIEALVGLQAAVAQAMGAAKAPLLWSLARAQVALDDPGGARATQTLMTDKWRRDSTLDAIARWLSRHGDYAGALATAGAMEDKGLMRWVVCDVASRQAKAGAVDAALATLRANGPAEGAQYDSLAVLLLFDGKPDDAVAVSKAGGTSEGLSRIHAGVAERMAKDGKADEARRVLALLGTAALDDPTALMRVASAHAALGEFDEARKALGRISIKEAFVSRVLAAREVAERLAAKGDAAGARGMMRELVDAAEVAGSLAERKIALSNMASALEGGGDLDGAEATAWLMDDEYLRRSFLATILRLRGKVREGEIETWAQSARFYEAFGSSFSIVTDMRAWLESQKGRAAADVYDEMLRGAETLENALTSVSNTEARLAGYRAKK